MISFLLSGDVSLSLISYVMTTISFFDFITNLNNMMKTNSFLTILLGWTMAILNGTNRVNRGEILVQGSLIAIA